MYDPWPAGADGSRDLFGQSSTCYHVLLFFQLQFELEFSGPVVLVLFSFSDLRRHD